jgi:hypothetical protein
MEIIMQSSKFVLSSLRARLAGAVFGLVCSLSVLAAVFGVFASASGELDPAWAKLKAAPSASEVASKVPAKPVRG